MVKHSLKGLILRKPRLFRPSGKHSKISKHFRFSMPPAPTTPLQPSTVPTNSKKRKRDEVDLPPPPTRSQRSSKRLKQETNVTLSLFLQKLREEKQHLPQEKTQPIKHLAHYSHHSLEKISYAIFLRFGSLTSPEYSLYSPR